MWNHRNARGGGGDLGGGAFAAGGARAGERLRGGNMHSHVAPKLLKIVRASNKVRFTVNLDEHT